MLELPTFDPEVTDIEEMNLTELRAVARLHATVTPTTSWLAVRMAVNAFADAYLEGFIALDLATASSLVLVRSALGTTI